MNRSSYMRDALSLVLGLIFLSAASAQEAASGDELPSPESILDRYVEVTGGAAAYESRTSETATGTFAIPAQNLNGQLEIFMRPGLSRTIIEIPGVGLIEQGVNDGVAWESNPITGPQILEGPVAEYTIHNSRPDAMLHWVDGFSSVETTGIEDVNGEAAYRVVGNLSGAEIMSLFAVDSGLLLKNEYTASTPFGEIPIEQLMGEYSDVDGILSPHRIVSMQAGQQTVITLTAAEANVEIPDERFDLPEAVQALLE